MLKRRNALRNNKGFSLVELIVVIAIIGVLAAIAIPNVMGALQRSKAAADVATAATIASSIKLAIAEDKYSATHSTPTLLSTIGTTLVSKGYLDHIPTVQAISLSNFYVSFGVGGSDMKIYVSTGTGTLDTTKAVQLYPSKVAASSSEAGALNSAYGF